MLPKSLGGFRGSLLIVALTVVLAGCAPIPSFGPGPARGTPVPPGETPATTPLPGGPDATAAVNMRRLLAQQLGVRVETVKVVSAEPTEWTDSCLGAGGPAESCGQVVVPGYKLTFDVSGQTYVLHTDPQGYQWRVAAAPAPIIGDAVIQWMGTGEDGSCREAILGMDRIAFGRCGGRLLGAPYVSPARLAVLKDLAARYSSFEAQTATGKVQFTGAGSQSASGAEQRMVAEFAWLAQTEAQTGQAGVSWGLALTWHREGGIAGFCDDLTIDTSGEVFATGCKGAGVQLVGSTRLDAQQLERLYGWMDRLQPFEYEVRDAAAADAMAVRVLFGGRGSSEAAETDRQAIARFAQELFAGLQAGAQGGTGSGQDAMSLCPQPTAELQALVNPEHGYCLAYPRKYKVEKPNENETLWVMGGLLNASDARLHVSVSEAGDRTAEQAASEIEAGFKDMGVQRRQTTVSGIPAVVLDKVPGQEINRRVLFVQNGRLYELLFAPADAAVGAAFSEMEALYEQVLRSFTFIPATTEVANECLAPGTDEELLLSGTYGFCLLHPARFTADESTPDQVTLYVDSAMNVADPKLFVTVEDAAGRTAESAAEAVAQEAQAALPDLMMDRSFGWTIGYEPAAFLDGVPGQDLSRQVFVVHNDRLYRLTFVPSDPASQAEVTAEMEALFELVLRSWRFLD